MCLCRTLEDVILPAMREMNEKACTHIQITKQGVAIGVLGIIIELLFVAANGKKKKKRSGIHSAWDLAWME